MRLSPCGVTRELTRAECFEASRGACAHVVVEGGDGGVCVCVCVCVCGGGVLDPGIGSGRGIVAPIVSSTASDCSSTANAGLLSRKALASRPERGCRGSTDMWPFIDSGYPAARVAACVGRAAHGIVVSAHWLQGTSGRDLRASVRE
jgi:hypothetical protein